MCRGQLYKTDEVLDLLEVISESIQSFEETYKTLACKVNGIVGGGVEAGHGGGACGSRNEVR